MKLSERQIEYGFYYYFAEEAQSIRWITEVSEYNGEKELNINCTQLCDSTYKAKDKKRIQSEWCEFLRDTPKAFTKLNFSTRMTQNLFDAVCNQTDLENLEIKWGAYKDLSAINKLTKLKLLYIGSGSGVESIAPLTELKNLKGLYIENFKKVSDYSGLANLNELESLSLSGNILGPQIIKVESLSFLREMNQLKHLKSLAIKVLDSDYSPILDLASLEHLSLGNRREIKDLYSEFIKLPNLKWGLLKERPSNYVK